MIPGIPVCAFHGKPATPPHSMAVAAFRISESDRPRIFRNAARTTCDALS